MPTHMSTHAYTHAYTHVHTQVVFDGSMMVVAPLLAVGTYYFSVHEVRGMHVRSYGMCRGVCILSPMYFFFVFGKAAKRWVSQSPGSLNGLAWEPTG